MAKMGRPAVENPKKHMVGLKMTDDEIERLKTYAAKKEKPYLKFCRMQSIFNMKQTKRSNPYIFPFLNEGRNTWQNQEKTVKAGY